MKWKPEREEPRYNVDARVEVGGNAEPARMPHRVRNLSLGGICLESAEIQDVGTVVDLDIRFPDLGSSLTVKGKVMWVNRAPPTDLGIRFLDLDEEKRGLLREFLRRVAIAAPPD